MCGSEDYVQMHHSFGKIAKCSNTKVMAKTLGFQIVQLNLNMNL